MVRVAPTMPGTPTLSVLDLIPVAEGQSSADAVAASARLVRRADELGYHRYWVAEHHNTELVASTTPPVLLAALGAGTQRIRLGSGGVMLPNHAPFVIAEQFATLESLYPGRIDLGLGRAPGTDPFTAAAMRRDLSRDRVDEFPNDVLELMGYLGDVRAEHDREVLNRLRVSPGAKTNPQIWLLGSSLYGAELAAAFGLPYTFAHHFAMHADPKAAADHYRDHFVPSPVLAEPHFMVSVSAIAAETVDEATRLALPSRAAMHQIRFGRPTRVLSPEGAAAYADRMQDRSLYDATTGTQLVGTPEMVADGIDRLIERTGADEVILAATTHDVEVRIRTIEAIAELRDPAAWEPRATVGAHPHN
ncbi:MULTISPECIES: LLM class flavin-dependent oxidoreductase [unclassified Pseudoclavibacter]|uniref:LLM class flavin-dependent oxidoreductase n=1 Tax=unclassified Pseudoclavibacter TaxID=2615177 RepID=UPI0021578074|nr:MULTISPECIES: LLM class flavin-dependent oxidoreductase [unclassified Pseudoclavibacter]